MVAWLILGGVTVLSHGKMEAKEI